MGNKKRYKLLGALLGGIFLTAAAAWLPLLTDWLVGLNLPASVAMDLAYGIFFFLAAGVSYAFVTELIRARIQTRRCEEVLDTSKAARLHDKQLFHALVSKEIDLARRQGWPVSMLAVLVVPMKGQHVPADKNVSVQVRDVVLAELEKVLRSSDMVGSFARNEYLVFLPNCPSSHVEEIARRILKSVGSKKIVVDEQTTYSLECKVGTTSLEPQVADFKRLTTRAFEALDKAREKDFNAIESY